MSTTFVQQIGFASQDKNKLIVAVLKAAFPIFVTLEALALIGVVDLELAGRISASAQAAVGLGDQLLFLTSTAASGLSVATCAVAARYFGAGNSKQTIATIRSSLMVATICGIASSLLGYFAADSFVRLLSSDPDVITHGARYIQLCAIGMFPYVVSIVVASMFRAIGRTAESLYLSLTTSILAVPLSYVFFDQGPLKQSLEALCVAWIIGAYIGLTAGITVLLKRIETIGSLRNCTWRKEKRLVKLLLSIGIAVVLADSATLATDFLIYKLLSLLDNATSMQASWTIFLKVEETIAIMPISALSLAFAATVGHLIGQDREDEARQCLKFLSIAASVLFSLVGAIFFAAPNTMAVFSHCDPTVFENSTQLLALVPVFFPLLTIRLLMFSFMEGAGQTSVPMKLSLLGNAVKLVVAGVLMNMISLGTGGLIAAIMVSRTMLALGSILAIARRTRPNAPGAR